MFKRIQMGEFDIAVAPDVNVIRTAIWNLFRGADVDVEAIGDGVMLTGTVSSEADAYQACEIALHFVVSDNFAGGGSRAAAARPPRPSWGPGNAQTISSDNQFGYTSSTTSSSGGAGAYMQGGKGC